MSQPLALSSPSISLPAIVTGECAHAWPASLLNQLAQQAASGEDSFADFLEKLLAAETDARSERSRQALLKTAAFRSGRTMSTS